MNKKISLGIAIGLMALAAAVTFIITYNFSLNVFNSKVRNVSERESTYARLSEMDSYVRANFFNAIDENKLTDSIMKGPFRKILHRRGIRHADPERIGSYYRIRV